jgi:hypothetical protein
MGTTQTMFVCLFVYISGYFLAEVVVFQAFDAMTYQASVPG